MALKIQIETEYFFLQMRIHAESEACDLLIEVERLDLLDKYVDKQAYNRVCL